MPVASIRNRLRRWSWLVSLWKTSRHTKARLFGPHPKRLRDVDLRHDTSQPLTKRALLSYIVHPFSISPDAPRFLQHINIWRAREMVKILNELGYAVDVIDYRDTSFKPQRGYDLFVGHGGINFSKIARHLPDTSKGIYFATGCYWEFHNKEELSRFAALRERRGAELPPDRLIKESEQEALLLADGIIAMGNDFTRATYAGFSPVIMISDTALACDDRLESQGKNYESARSRFLYFAGTGAVHKGLDLLLEAFVGLEQQLWICSKIEEQFLAVYADELHKCPNIHLVGWVQPRSSQFYWLIESCNWVILPSCAEGQPHSVLECMNHGLVPVVSQACGLDVGDFGVIIEPCTIGGIARLVRSLASCSATQCREMSRKARNAAANDHSEAAFQRSFAGAIRDLADKR